MTIGIVHYSSCFGGPLRHCIALVVALQVVPPRCFSEHMIHADVAVYFFFHINIFVNLPIVTMSLSQLPDKCP